MKEQTRAPKTGLSDEEIVKLSDAQFKTLVIRMLTKTVEYGGKIEEKNECYAKWNKAKYAGTNSKGKETEIQINGLRQKEKINIQPEKNAETRIQKKWGEA